MFAVLMRSVKILMISMVSRPCMVMCHNLIVVNASTTFQMHLEPKLLQQITVTILLTTCFLNRMD